MKVVIDTNVVVSSVLRGGLPLEAVLFVVGETECQWVATREIIDEYIEVITRPKLKLSAERQQTWIELIGDTIEIVESEIAIDFPRDQKDAKFLACAAVAQAEYLITGDRDFEEARQMGPTTIVSVRKFKETVIDHWLGS